MIEFFIGLFLGAAVVFLMFSCLIVGTADDCLHQFRFELCKAINSVSDEDGKVDKMTVINIVKDLPNEYYMEEVSEKSM